MKKLQLALLFILAVSTILVVAVFALPSFINWQNNKGFIENIASDFLGYHIKIKGDLQVQLLPNPKVYAQNITVDSLSGNENLVEIEHVIVNKKLSDLFVFDFSIENMEINRPTINLTVDESGSKNWEPLKIKNSNYYSRKLKNTVLGLIEFKNVTIENAKITYTNITEEKNLDVSNIYLDIESANRVMNINGNGVFADKEQKINLKLDLSNADSARLSSKLSNEEYMFDVKGIISNIFNLNRAQFNGKIRSEFADANNINLDNALFKFNKRYFNLKNFKLESDFILSKNKLALSAIKVDSKYNKLTGSFDYAKNKDKFNIALDLDIDKLYIEEGENMENSNNKLEWSDTALDFSFLNNLNLGVSINCLECTYGEQKFYQANLKSSLEHNNLIINQFVLKTDKENFAKVSATIGLNSPVSAEIKLESQNFPLDTILPKNITEKIGVDLNGNATFSSSGTSYKSLFANLTSSFDLTLADVILRRINVSSTKAMLEGLLKNKYRTNFDVKAQPIALKGTVRDGVLRTADVEMETDYQSIMAKGKLDLANLTMNYRIEPTNLTRKNLGAVISGNINNPDIISDKITPKGVIDGFNRIVTTRIINKPNKPKIKVPFDFDDKPNLRKNVEEYLFEDSKDEN